MRYIIAYLLKPLIEYSLEKRIAFFTLPFIVVQIFVLLFHIRKYIKFKSKTLKNYKKWEFKDFLILFFVDGIILLMVIIATIIIQGLMME